MTELENRSFRCLDDCAMCCLCQPELSDKELEAFRVAGIESGLTNEHLDGRETDKTTAIKLQGGCGACHFLKDRRCTIYELRTRYCRQFPVHVHALDRIQLISNLSCRGISEGGVTLREFGEEVLANIPEGQTVSELKASRKLLAEFERRARKGGVWQPPERLREAGDALLPLLAERDGIGSLLAFADMEPEIGEMPIDFLVPRIAAMRPPEDLEIIANLANYEQFELENISWLPIYVTPDFDWFLIQSKDEHILWLALEETGGTEVRVRIPKNDVGLLTPDADALGVFGRYAGILNRRDNFLGYVYHLSVEEGFQNDLMTVYLGTLATMLLDLWWRTSLIGRINGRTTIDGRLAREGIIAFDMGCQDAPTIGTFF